MQQAAPISSEVIASGKFIELRRINFQDAHGRSRQWEAAVRSPDCGAAGAVMIIARLMPERRIVLVRQFRPPTGKYVIEAPAGLIDPGETPEAAARRELFEETGYTGELVKLLPGGYSSAGLTNETVATAIIDIPSEQYLGAPPVSHPEETEEIEVFDVPEDTLLEFLEHEISAGNGVSVKLLLYAYAVNMRN